MNFNNCPLCNEESLILDYHDKEVKDKTNREYYIYCESCDVYEVSFKINDPTKIVGEIFIIESETLVYKVERTFGRTSFYQWMILSNSNSNPIQGKEPSRIRETPLKDIYSVLDIEKFNSIEKINKIVLYNLY